ncbi:MAG: hypothetical protein GWO81_00820 [Verrucomicrobia bacterium]|nr:hypothetical protein [Verrucomicrobiota bacterium]
MNIALCLDLNFLPYCSTTIQSVIENHSSKDRIHFFISYTFDSKFLTPILRQISAAGHQVTCLTINSNRLKKFQTRAHFTEANYLRLFLPELLPENITRALYLDSDLIVRTDLTELYQENLKGFSTAMAPELQNKNHNPRHKRYYNSGVLLMDVQAWRNGNNSERIITYTKEHPEKLEFVDQDAINNTIHDETKSLDLRWNCITPYYNAKLERDYSAKHIELIKAAISKSSIVHFTTASKPWNYINCHPYKKEYWQYLNNTPYKNTRPTGKNFSHMLKKLEIYIRHKYLR